MTNNTTQQSTEQHNKESSRIIIRSFKARKHINDDKYLFFYIKNGVLKSALYNQEDKKKNYEIISNNLIDIKTDKKILNQFQDNAKLLKTIKGGNYYLHEAIVLEETHHIPYEQQVEIVKDLTRKYIKERCPNNLVFGMIHRTRKPHAHIMISANPIHERKRLRLSKDEFLHSQVQTEQYKRQVYPELGQETIYKQILEQKQEKTYKRTINPQGKDKEYQYKHRTNKQSRNDIIKQKIREALLDSYSIEQFKRKLKNTGLEYYHNSDKQLGVINLEEQRKNKKNPRHRFETLGLLKEYNDFLEHIKEMQEIDKEYEEYNKIKEQNNQIANQRNSELKNIRDEELEKNKEDEWERG